MNVWPIQLPWCLSTAGWRRRWRRVWHCTDSHSLDILPYLEISRSFPSSAWCVKVHNLTDASSGHTPHQVLASETTSFQTCGRSKRCWVWFNREIKCWVFVAEWCKQRAKSRIFFLRSFFCLLIWNKNSEIQVPYVQMLKDVFFSFWFDLMIVLHICVFTNFRFACACI